MVDRLAIVGLGLIGASLAKALKARGAVGTVVATGHREGSLKKGLEQGVIDEWTLDLAEAVRGADVVVIATPTLVAERVLRDLEPLLTERTVVTDVASVKGNLVRAAREIYGEVPANFVPGHPIAGSERSGVDAARAELFVDHRVILTPVAATSPDALAAVRAMWEAAGAIVSTMDVAEHDAVLAATSHLPHVLAYALVDALAREPSATDIFRYAAGGFRDFTRIASSDPVMWHDIVLANRDAVLAAMDRFSDNLAQLRQAIAAGDGETITAVFKNAKAARDRHVLRPPQPTDEQTGEQE